MPTSESARARRARIVECLTAAQRAAEPDTPRAEGLQALLEARRVADPTLASAPDEVVLAHLNVEYLVARRAQRPPATPTAAGRAAWQSDLAPLLSAIRDVARQYGESSPAPRAVPFTTAGWAPSDAAQAEDRTRRRGV